jgi:hypothetical protein
MTESKRRNADPACSVDFWRRAADAPDCLESWQETFGTMAEARAMAEQIVDAGEADTATIESGRVHEDYTKAEGWTVSPAARPPRLPIGSGLN